MPKVRVTSDYQIKIPHEIKDRIGLVAGQELKVHLHGDHILLVPVRAETRQVRPKLAVATPAP